MQLAIKTCPGNPLGAVAITSSVNDTNVMLIAHQSTSGEYLETKSIVDICMYVHVFKTCHITVKLVY